MGYSVSAKFYSKECNNVKVLPYLETNDFCEVNSRLPHEFYEACNKYATYYPDNDCWVFDDLIKMLEFASLPICPVIISDYITENYAEDEPILIFWHY